MRKSQLIAALVAVAVACGWTLGSARAAIIQFEAESYDTIGTQMTVVANAAALGGQTIARTITGNPPSLIASYTVNFPESGTYDLYARIFTTGNASADSWFVGNNFGVLNTDVNNATDWTNLNGFAPFNNFFNGLTTVDGQVWQQGDDQIPNNIPIWINLSANFNENTPAAGAPVVGTYTVGFPGAETYQIAGREPNFLIDTLAFALTSEAGLVRIAEDGNLSLVPEPATCVLFGMAGLLPLGWRRRTS